MDEIFKIAGAIIVSFGGSSIILFSLSSWLGKVWANRILEKERLKYSIEIEKYKNELEIALQKSNLLNERANYISKKQYEKEFDILEEIWESFINLRDKTLNLFPIIEQRPVDKEELKKYKMDKYINYANAFNEYSKLIRKYSPFYNSELASLFFEFLNLCNEQGITYNTYIFSVLRDGSEDDWMSELTKTERNEVFDKIPDKISNLEKKLVEKIREYLHQLKVLH